MGAPEGNQFWKFRAKHGRDKIFSTPRQLWESCCEYFEITDNRKWVKKDWVGKDAVQVERETETPYTISGMCLFLDVSREWWYKFKESVKNDNDFLHIIARIENIIYTQKYEGAVVGAFNANLIARDLGLHKDQEESAESITKAIHDLIEAMPD